MSNVHFPGACLDRISELCRHKWVICLHWLQSLCSETVTHFDGCVTAHLQSLLLWRQGVDDSDPPGFGRESSHLVAFVLPPWLAKVGGPVAARSSGGHVNKAASRGVVPHALGLRIHKLEDLRRVYGVRLDLFRSLLPDGLMFSWTFLHPQSQGRTSCWCLFLQTPWLAGGGRHLPTNRTCVTWFEQWPICMHSPSYC